MEKNVLSREDKDANVLRLEQKEYRRGLGSVAHTCNPSTLGG